MVVVVQVVVERCCRWWWRRGWRWGFWVVRVLLSARAARGKTRLGALNIPSPAQPSPKTWTLLKINLAKIPTPVDICIHIPWLARGIPPIPTEYRNQLLHPYRLLQVYKHHRRRATQWYWYLHTHISYPVGSKHEFFKPFTQPSDGRGEGEGRKLRNKK